MMKNGHPIMKNNEKMMRKSTSPVCDSVGDASCQGVPLRAEGFPKRRCQFESVAAKPHLSPSERPSFVKACHYTRMGFQSKSRGGPPFRTAPTQPRLGYFKHGKGLSHGDKPFRYWYWFGKRING